MYIFPQIFTAIGNYVSDLSNVSNELKIVEIYDVIMFGICARALFRHAAAYTVFPNCME